MITKCMFCDLEALDGHLTCGQVTCPESTARSLRNAKVMARAFDDIMGSAFPAFRSKPKDDEEQDI